MSNKEVIEIERMIKQLEADARRTVGRVESESGMVMNGSSKGLFFSSRDIEL